VTDTGLNSSRARQGSKDGAGSSSSTSGGVYAALPRRVSGGAGNTTDRSAGHVTDRSAGHVTDRTDRSMPGSTLKCSMICAGQAHVDVSIVSVTVIDRTDRSMPGSTLKCSMICAGQVL
jgi:hypothetical protein